MRKPNKKQCDEVNLIHTGENARAEPIKVCRKTIPGIGKTKSFPVKEYLEPRIIIGDGGLPRFEQEGDDDITGDLEITETLINQIVNILIKKYPSSSLIERGTEEVKTIIIKEALLITALSVEEDKIEEIKDAYLKKCNSIS